MTESDTQILNRPPVAVAVKPRRAAGPHGPVPPVHWDRLDEAPDWRDLAPTGWYAERGKRLLDLLLLSVALPLALAPLAVVALVNLVAHGDPRKILFTQERVGWRGRRFVIYKFRTMKDAPRGSMESWRQGADPRRVTALGRWLRNTHLDELPQLLNVLRGDMQFIGPRPEMVEVEAWAARNVPGFSHRLAIRPGITGLAQITQGYAACDPEAYATKLGINLSYIQRLCLRVDVEIVLRTALWVLRRRGSRWSTTMPRPAE